MTDEEFLAYLGERSGLNRFQAEQMLDVWRLAGRPEVSEVFTAIPCCPECQSTGQRLAEDLGRQGPR